MSKRKLSKLIAAESGTDEESEHELSYYIEDRVKLMKEILKIIKPKKMKSMAPECMKNMDMQEINSMLLEELLGISNKRLKYIFEGKTLEEDSSTDEDHVEDVISLDDISDDDFIVISDDETNKSRHKHRRNRIKKEPTGKRRSIKKEKPDKNKVKEIEQVKEKLNRGGKATSKEKDAIGEENLMSVLELLELQARARAIKSQLELENKKKQDQKVTESNSKADILQPEDDDEVIMEIPKQEEIIITSSDSENEGTTQQLTVEVSSPTIAPREADSSTQINENSVEGNASERTINEDSVTNVNQETIRTTMRVESEEVVKAHKTDSDSSSNDSLQVIQDREKRRNLAKKVLLHEEEIEAAEPKESKKEQLQNSKLDKAIEKFIESQPVVLENIEQRKKMEQQRKDRDEKKKIRKEKRLKKLKNEIESFKQDVAVENCTVNVLQNIVIKPKPNADESDDLVINVDQNDVDCMICD